MDRAALRARVFENDEERKALESILHPLIRTQVASQLAEVSSDYAVVVVPLLVETGGYATLCDRVLVVDCAEETQIARTMRRSQLSESQVLAIMAAQASRPQRLAVATDVVTNDGSIDDLHAQIDQLHKIYSGLTKAPEEKNA